MSVPGGPPGPERRDAGDGPLPNNPLGSYRRYVVEAWAVYGAITAGVFDALTQPASLSTLCQDHGWNRSALQALLRALTACGHVSVSPDGWYSLTDRGRRLFLSSSDDYIGDALSFLRTTPAYMRYPEILRGSEAIGLSEAQWSYVTRGSAMYATAGVRTLLAHFPELWGHRDLAVLDVGCGQGVYLQELSEALPHARLLGIDPTQAVVEEAKARLGALGARAPEVRRAHLADVEGAFDVVLINQLFHMTGAKAAVAMLDQARAKLKPGGFVFVQEILVHDDNPLPALFGLNMRLLFNEGCALTRDELIDMIAGAGFQDVETHPIKELTPGLTYVSGRV